MKNTFGKLGYGLSGAVAAVGLMSAGVQTANAEIVLTTSSPVETLGTVASFGQTYDFTYNLQLAAVGTILDTTPNAASFSLYLGGANAELASVPVFTMQDAAITIAGGYFDAPVVSAGSYQWDYAGTAYTSTVNNETLGYVTVQSYSPNAYSPPNSTLDMFNSMSNSSGDLADANQKVINGPSISGTPLAPLALPVAVWPGLLTLAGMVVAGGLKMRRRSFNVH